jgi:hypothetical protein
MSLIDPDLLTRQDVQVNRRTGIVEAKANGGYVVGGVSQSTNAAGQPIWRATAQDLQSFDFTREGAVEKVLDLWNLTEKARAYDLLVRRRAS